MSRPIVVSRVIARRFTWQDGKPCPEVLTLDRPHKLHLAIAKAADWVAGFEDAEVEVRKWRQIVSRASGFYVRQWLELPPELAVSGMWAETYAKYFAGIEGSKA